MVRQGYRSRYRRRLTHSLCDSLGAGLVPRSRRPAGSRGILRRFDRATAAELVGVRVQAAGGTLLSALGSNDQPKLN